jgi:hypothetical protein
MCVISHNFLFFIDFKQCELKLAEVKADLLDDLMTLYVLCSRVVVIEL